ncbi:hypothetical protein U9890_23220 [Escherichia coli]|nr:hypothetical protein [Escherichia coli]HDC4249420.1 hypothetical protein [Escherichia coli]
MLKTITLNSKLPIINDVLLSKSVIAEKINKSDTEREFRKKLTRIYKDTEDNIDKLKINAIVEGFEQGFLEMISVMASYFTDYNRIYLSLQEDIMALIREALVASTEQPETILCLFDEWLAGQPLEGDILNVVLPEKCRFLSSKIMKKIESCWSGKIDISYSETFCFILKNNKHIVEFRAKDYLDALLPYYNPTLQKAKCENICLSDKALSNLIETLNQYQLTINNEDMDKENNHD